MVGVLYYGAIDREHDRCMRALHTHPMVGELKELYGCAYIDIGRSLLATKALENPDCAGILFVDHDILFETEEVTKLLESCLATDSIIGGAYSMRRPGAEMIGAIDTDSLEQGEQVVFFDGGRVYPAAYLGMGFTVIPRSALEKMAPTCEPVMTGIFPDPVRPFFHTLVEDGKWFGEDVAFCLRARRAGAQVCMDSRIRIYHKGTYTYGLEDCGIVVPFMKRLIGIIKESPAVKSSDYCPNPQVQEALGLHRESLEKVDPFPSSESPNAPLAAAS